MQQINNIWPYSVETAWKFFLMLQVIFRGTETA